MLNPINRNSAVCPRGLEAPNEIRGVCRVLRDPVVLPEGYMPLDDHLRPLGLLEEGVHILVQRTHGAQAMRLLSDLPRPGESRTAASLPRPILEDSAHTLFDMGVISDQQRDQLLQSAWLTEPRGDALAAGASVTADAKTSSALAREYLPIGVAAVSTLGVAGAVVLRAYAVDEEFDKPVHNATQLIASALLPAACLTLGLGKLMLSLRTRELRRQLAEACQAGGDRASSSSGDRSASTAGSSAD